MMLTFPLLDEPITFKENSAEILVIENPLAYRKAIISLHSQADNQDGDFVLSADYRPLPFGKYAEVITDVFRIDLSSRKLLSGIQKEALALSQDCEPLVDQIISNMNELGTYIVSSLDFDTVFTPLSDAAPLVNALAIKPDADDVSLPEKLLNYMRLCRRFLGKDLFIPVNFLPCLTEEETELFLRSVFYEKIRCDVS